MSLSALCQYSYRLTLEKANYLTSRTYGGETGEDIREGYEPMDAVAVDETDEFTIGEDEGQESEESRHWKQTEDAKGLLMPKYGLDGEDFENVWKGGEPSEAPKENP